MQVLGLWKSASEETQSKCGDDSKILPGRTAIIGSSER